MEVCAPFLLNTATAHIYLCMLLSRAAFTRSAKPVSKAV